jgi:arylsulfatase A-like enzyme
MHTRLLIQRTTHMVKRSPLQMRLVGWMRFVGPRQRWSLNWLVLSGCLLGANSPATHAAGEPAPRPNIVFILADDLGWGELGCYGQTKIRTPNIDQLAAEGMRFTRHYSGAPVCAPARNVLMTGRHLGHAEIRGNKQASPGGEGQWPISTNYITLPRVLRQAGYATGAVGKWGLGPVGSSGDPNRQGFDLFFGYNCQSLAHSYFPAHLWRNEQKLVINAPPIPGHAKQPEGEVHLESWQGKVYAPDLIEAAAVDFIRTNASRPFFLYCAFTEPHVAMQPPPRLVESYPREWDDAPYRGQCGYLPHPRPRAGYAAIITSLDEHVGKVLAALKRAGVESNTIVIFTSDNGTTHRGNDPVFGIGGVDAAFFNSTRGLRGFKGSVYEGGLRVPFIVRWPGRVRAGSTNDFPSYFPDHFATLTDLLKLAPPGERDGLSLLPIWLGQPAPVRNPMVWVFPEYGGQVCVRLGEFKVIRQKLLTKQPGDWEVYDVQSDPAESRDLAAEKPDLIRAASDVLRAQMNDNPVFPLPVPGVNR